MVLVDNLIDQTVLLTMMTFSQLSDAAALQAKLSKQEKQAQKGLSEAGKNRRAMEGNAGKEGPKLRALQPWLSEEEAERLVVGKIWIGMDYLELTLARGDPDDMHTLVFQDNNHVQHVNSTVYYTGRDAVVARVASVLSKNNGIRGRFGRDLVLPVTTIKLRRTLPKR